MKYKFLRQNISNIFKFILILSLSINPLLANLYLPANHNYLDTKITSKGFLSKKTTYTQNARCVYGI
ncbi:MAG: hypothetical protein SPI03_02075 [Campylobacter sputorum]|uniref:hypothetical protein n=1 Tax=Campylobacter sputorum TaxID=206 RepID=UPI000B76D47B|nr:hypothetical protein [Campylobacter sputorum]KAB0581017.1 hypothetical protein F7P64_07820 [Campylobacter sputorum subsp. sputorum]MDY6120117.1 hypothetical protein [Campylobacter sputorum]